MNWYAVNVKPHQEQLAELNLRRVGVETFCPFVKQRKTIRRRQRISTSPLFPGYLFARFRLQDQYRAVLYARGVRKIVAFGPTPATVDEEMIAAIRSRLQDGYVTVPTSTFRPGQIVRIQEGPLHGLEAIFEREMPGYQRAVLLLRALSFQARVTVDVAHIVNL
ncbi:MAG: transcription termination/antitermination protein NusG [Nitrospiraceae bacterium]